MRRAISLDDGRIVALDSLCVEAVQKVLHKQAAVGVHTHRHRILATNLKRIRLHLNNLGARIDQLPIEGVHIAELTTQTHHNIGVGQEGIRSRQAEMADQAAGQRMMLGYGPTAHLRRNHRN